MFDIAIISATLVKGIIVGFVIAAPVGPVGFLCIERALNKGRLSGMVSGLGAATADAFYSAVAAFGLIQISHFLFDFQYPIRIVGGVFLLYLGASYLIKKATVINSNGSGNKKEIKLFADFVSALFLTATNPLTIVSFAILFAGMPTLDYGPVLATTLTIGVFIGSVMCWLLLVGVTIWIESRSKKFSLKMMNRVAGIAMLIFATLIFWSL